MAEYELSPLPAVACELSVSLVIHALDSDVLAQTLESLQQAITHARNAGALKAVTVWLIDNSPAGELREPLTELGSVLTPHAELHILSGHGNIGFGRAHNLALTALCQEAALSGEAALSW